MKQELKQLQAVELDILKQVLPIIEAHGLTYYMLGGTLLGAVRHKGFIPWDDDIDIGMPRPDYERFVQLAAQELHAPYQLHTFLSAKGEYGYYYARVENAGVRLVRSATKKVTEIPAWIDIFPLDGVPEEEGAFSQWLKAAQRKKLNFKLSQFDYFFSVDSTKKSSHAAGIIALKRLISATKVYRLLRPEACWRALDKCLKSNDYGASSRLINFCGFWGLKEMFPKSVYGNGRLYPFEDLMLNGPEDYDAVLTQMYGDYMTPPPDADKEHHYVELIESPAK